MKLITSILAILLVSGCHLEIGKPKKIKCYSGIFKIYEGTSKGKVVFYDNGISFTDKETNTRMRVNGNCSVKDL